MLRSLFTGISGLTAHQQMLDTTSNNIANVNTIGFKGSDTVFEDTLSQTLQGGGKGTPTQGGTNPEQIGLGVRLASTDLNFGQGSQQPTGVPSNMMITGDGFFTVTKNNQNLYTRAGAFKLDDAGHLAAPDGALLQADDGTTLTLTSLIDGTYVSYNIDSNGAIYGVDSSGTTTQIGQVGMATFANPNGLEKVGDSEYRTSASSGAAQVGAPNTAGRGGIVAGYVEMSNVDLSAELTNLIIAERGFQANSKVITTSDEVLQTLVSLKN